MHVLTAHRWFARQVWSHTRASFGKDSGGGECALCALHGAGLTSVGMQVVKGLSYLWNLKIMHRGKRIR